MFDRSQEIELHVRPASAGLVLTPVVVRYPTDDEWAKLLSARRIKVRHMSRGITETLAPPPCEADSRLYEAIAINGAPKMTMAEAKQAIDALNVSQITDVRIEGTEAEVDMYILSGEVHHRMKVPTADQAEELERSGYRSYTLPYSQNEIRLNVGVGARLYDECGGKSDGYQGSVPAPHKDAAFRAVKDFIDRQLRPKQDDENF
jgi:hypothetical protein